MENELATGFPDAPADVLNIARLIIEGQVPPTSDLGALGLDTLNRSWSNPFAKDFPEAGHSLLRQAVVSRNLEAAKTLILAGADPNYNGNEMPFDAVRMSADTPMVWFPDYKLGTEFLKLWLQSGGKVDATCPLWSGGPILYSVSPDNLEAMLFLLKSGADPWFNPTPPDDPTYFYDNFFQMHANATLISSELAFRLAKEGHYRNADPDKAAILIANYEDLAEQYKDASGPEDLRAVWGMQMALAEILPQVNATPSGAIAAVLAIDVPDDIGGFFLAAGEIRSPQDADQLVTNSNQSGNERWGK